MTYVVRWYGVWHAASFLLGTIAPLGMDVTIEAVE